MKIKTLKDTMAEGRHISKETTLDVALPTARALVRAGKAVPLNADGSLMPLSEIFPPASLPVGPITVSLPTP